jgi:hypothetical protein
MHRIVRSRRTTGKPSLLRARSPEQGQHKDQVGRTRAVPSSLPHGHSRHALRRPARRPRRRGHNLRAHNRNPANRSRNPPAPSR